LRRLVEDGKLADVRFVGKVDPRDIPRLYDEADIYLNASVVDNQPVSILEAFAAGVPVISTGTGDIPAMVQHEQTGLLVPPFDPDAIAQSVMALLAQPERALSFARRAHDTIGRYTWPAVRDAWADVYQPRGPRGALDPWTTHQAH
jgi:glycosyltransferase involved in cell wall biosynthesis